MCGCVCACALMLEAKACMRRQGQHINFLCGIKQTVCEQNLTNIYINWNEHFKHLTDIHSTHTSYMYTHIHSTPFQLILIYHVMYANYKEGEGSNSLRASSIILASLHTNQQYYTLNSISLKQNPIWHMKSRVNQYNNCKQFGKTKNIITNRKVLVLLYKCWSTRFDLEPKT